MTWLFDREEVVLYRPGVINNSDQIRSTLLMAAVNEAYEWCESTLSKSITSWKWKNTHFTTLKQPQKAVSCQL